MFEGLSKKRLVNILLLFTITLITLKKISPPELNAYILIRKTLLLSLDRPNLCSIM
jgi:hypothetical protein